MGSIRFLLLFSCLPAMVLAQDPLIPRAEFFTETVNHSVRLGPMGEKVGYITVQDGTQSLILRGVKDVKLSHDSLGSVSQWTFSHMPERLLVVYSTDGLNRLFMVDANDGNHRELMKGGAQRIRLVGGSRKHAGEWMIHVTDELPEKSGFFTVSLDSGIPAPVGDHNECTQVWFDENFRLRAGIRMREDGMRELWRRDDHGRWYLLYDYDFLDGFVSNVVSLEENGNRLFITDNHDEDKAVLKEIDVHTGTIDVIMSDPNADLLYAGANIEQGIPQAIVSYYKGMERHFMNSEIQASFEELHNRLKGDISFVNASDNNRQWLVRVMDGGPLDYYFFDRDDKTLLFLFSDHPNLDNKALAKRFPKVIEARDGVKLPCDIFLPSWVEQRPDGLPTEPLPTILYVHGGPWIGFVQNSWFANRSMQLLANRGYAVIRCEFRGANGFGKGFMAKGNKEWGRKMHYDLVDIANWAVKNNLANKEEVAMWGWSYGGYSTAAALAFAPDVFACGLAMYGVYDLEAFSRIPYTDSQLWRNRVGDVKNTDDLKRIRQHAPINKIKKIKAPLYMTHGGKDEVTPVSQSDTLAALLTQYNKAFLYTVYPEEPHDYRQPESWISYWAIGEQFLESYLGGRSQPIGKDLSGANFELKDHTIMQGTVPSN